MNQIFFSLPLVFGLLSSGATGQVRTDFVFHVYVDPSHGDDDSAWELNPGNPLDAPNGEPNLDGFCRWPNDHRPSPLDRRDEVNLNNSPYSSQNGNYAMTGYLQHAPYTFRRLSGWHGAIEYVYRLFDDPNQPNPPAPILPWTNLANQVRVTHVVIHCLPGLYGPRDPSLPASTPDIDSETSLPWNGETFPIVMGQRPWGLGRLGLFDRVSIQGASALDTIFDGRGHDPSMPASWISHNIFEIYSRPLNGGGVPGTDHAQSFIDGLTIRNANSISGGGPNGHGIGIRMMGTGRVQMAVTNCFFLHNLVGIALDAFGIQDQAQQVWGGHEPLIVNNTFVDNHVSVWAGEVDQDDPPPTLPYLSNTHNPLIINNVLRGKVSAFEGLRRATLEVGWVDGIPITPQEFNAWLPAWTNSGFIPTAPNWSTASTGFATPPNLTGLQPGVDLANWPILFVRDLLEGALGVNNYHDYRLSPYASSDPDMPPGAMNPPTINPLIGAGVNRAQAGMGVPGIANVAGGGFSNSPGMPAGSEEAPVHGWDYDCEGFGNSRLLPRDGVMPNPLPTFGTIDIGADQCGSLIVAGYVPSTRMFVGEIPTTGSTLYDRSYFVDQPNQSGLWRPFDNWILGGLPWYDNVQSAPVVLDMWCSSYGPIETYYTEGMKFWDTTSFPNPTWVRSARNFLNVVGAIGPFPRNLACDFSPHLLSDIHGYWGQQFDSWTDGTFVWPLPNGQPYYPLPDPFGSNPHYHSAWNVVDPTTQQASGWLNVLFYPDNPSLFSNLTYLSAPHGDAVWDTYKQTNTWVWDGHLNPPGTLFQPGASLPYLLPPASQFGPFDVCGSNTFSTGAWGLNDACPDPLPLLQLDYAFRFNCEIPVVPAWGNANTNLQTFLVIMNAGGNAAAQSGSAGPSITQPTAVRLSHMLNIPSYLGSELDFECYCQAMRGQTGVVR